VFLLKILSKRAPLRPGSRLEQKKSRLTAGDDRCRRPRMDQAKIERRVEGVNARTVCPRTPSVVMRCDTIPISYFCFASCRDVAFPERTRTAVHFRAAHSSAERSRQPGSRRFRDERANFSNFFCQTKNAMALLLWGLRLFHKKELRGQLPSIHRRRDDHESCVRCQSGRSTASGRRGTFQGPGGVAPQGTRPPVFGGFATAFSGSAPFAIPHCTRVGCDRPRVTGRGPTEGRHTSSGLESRAA